tara:strand:+ start:408 stop:653 length:246 start_codon:yes stop_codon:yes gene_type:complete
MSTKKDTKNEEMFEDCPIAVAEYELEVGLNNVKRKPYSEFFVASQNNSDDYEVKIPQGTTADYGTYSDISHVKKVFITIKK